MSKGGTSTSDWMIGMPTSTNTVLIKNKYLLLGVLATFLLTTYALLEWKAPWVDECYTYYGINHDSFASFSNSIGSGINFSPPLYFLFNFLLNSIYPSSLELLRFESIAWTIVGAVLCFYTAKKLVGATAAFVGISLVLCNSDLLLSNSLEARHYTMFFACASWVLHDFAKQEDGKFGGIPTFLTHLSLCLVHYFGIIFSALIGFALLLQNKKFSFWKRLPVPLVASWIAAIPCHLLLICDQSSHLGNWPRPNTLNELLACYDGFVALLFVLVPIVLCLIFSGLNNTGSIRWSKSFKPMFLVSLLWMLTPFFAWLLSHVSEINLFKERYFIPKEAGLMLLISFGCHAIFQFLSLPEKSNIRRSLMVPIPICFVCIGLLGINYKRTKFSLDSQQNYYHWLLANRDLVNRGIPLVFSGDPVFFPNSYLHPNQSFFLINDDQMYGVYSRFSSKIKLIKETNLGDMDSFVLIADQKSLTNSSLSKFFLTDLGQFNQNLNLFCTLYEKSESSKPSPKS
jgi:hypothetical protein